MPATSTGNRPEYDARTRAELERYGFDDPYDPRFIYRAVFGTGMRGRPQVWPDIQMDVLHEVNPDVVGWIHMDGQAYFDAHPSVVIYDGTSYVECRWFAGLAYSSDDPWLERVSFSDDGDFTDWLARVADENRLKPPVQPCARDRVLVCCTCSMTPGLPNQYALLAVIGKGQDNGAKNTSGGF